MKKMEVNLLQFGQTWTIKHNFNQADQMLLFKATVSDAGGEAEKRGEEEKRRRESK